MTSSRCFPALDVGAVQPQCLRRCCPEEGRSTTNDLRGSMRHSAHENVRATRPMGKTRLSPPEKSPSAAARRTIDRASGPRRRIARAIRPDYRDMAGRTSRWNQASGSMDQDGTGIWVDESGISERDQASHREIRHPTEESGIPQRNQASHRGIRRLRYDWESYVRLPSSSNACVLVRQRTWVIDGRQGAADPTRGRGGALSLLGGGR
ncbi:uncharacterized protein SCHCODRAFT_02665787 [Schizophyllum commune H4-8]|uniref:uncharacterized protein n=1 Tax=Schizophyllum commune (strain H4-8 / FGSC 9210) TaxID=578458 RepID=UPI00215FB91D|nr:uncharacterized protein SCHCODRAFT_02665787 [Schizophyllum commune H4-8]KAI5895450.1 hypothetical protein SCHCODRAFT_02665787 [Schizophyllum commune H4-8]